MPKNTSERIIDRPLQGRQTARVWSGSSSTSSTDTSTTADALLAVDFITLNASATLTNERYLDVTNGLTKTDEGAGARLLLALEVPGTLSVSSTNTSTGNHTHGITSSSSPGAAASLLASSSAGNLTLPTFTASTKLTTPLIDTASGGLTISPANNTATINATTTIEGNLNVRRSSAFTAANIYSAGSGGSHYPRTALHQARGTIGTETATQSADILGSVSFRGHTGSAYLATGAAEIRGVASETFSGSANGANLRFLTTATGGTTLAERMRIHNSGNISIANTTDGGYALDVTGTGRITTSLTTPLLTTASNVDLVINPAGTGAVQFPNDQTIRTTSFDSSFPINGWQINEVAGVSGYSALTIGKIQADELAVRVFVADEVRVDRGDEFWTKSYGIVAATFTTPSSIGGTGSVMFEDSPALAGAIFTNNDWVLIRKLDIDTGITLSNIWGQVATYVNNSDGTQSWTFTLRSGPTSESVTKGSLAIDFGASGAALIHLSVIDAAGAPYIKMRKWSGANPYTPANFTTYVQLGNLGSTGNTYVTPAGFGLYARSTSDESRFILSDDNGLQIRGAAFKMYNASLQTVDISATNGSMKLGTDVSSAATTALDFNASTGDLAITGDLYTADVYLTQAEGILLNTGATDDYVSGYNTKSIQWFSDIDNPTGNALVTLAGAKATNDVYANLSAYSSAGIAKVRLIADSDVASTTDSQMYLRSQTGGNSTIYMFSDTISLQGINGVSSSALSVSGDITVSGNVDDVDIAAFKSAYDSHNHNSTYLALSGGTLTGTLTSRTVAPSANNTYDIGSSSNYFNNGYIRNLHTDTIVGTPSYAHSHAASDITSGTLDFARIPTNWTSSLVLDADSASTYNYVRWLTQASTGKAWDLVGRAHDYATTAQQNDLLLTYYDGSTIYTAFHADSATRVIDFGQTPTVGGTAVVLASRAVTAGSGMTGGGALSGDITISHADTSTQASVDNSGTTFIQDVTLDTYGHVTALTSTDVSSVLTGYVKTDGTTAGATSQAQAFNLGVIAIAPDATTAPLTLRSARTGLVATNIVGGIDFQSNDTNLTAPGTVTARILALANTTQTAAQLGTDLVFYTTTGTTLAEALRIAGGGAVTLASTLSVTGAVTGSSTAAFSGTVTTPTVSTASGNLTLTSTGGTVAVTGALTGSSTATFTTSVSTPSLITTSGTLTIAPANSTTSVTGALSLTGTLSSSSWGITSGGAATLVTATASTSVTTPTVTTASGNLTLTSAGGTVAVTGAASLTGTLSSTSWNITSAGTATLPTITNAGALTISPTGNITMTPGGNVTLGTPSTLGSNNYASQSTGWRIDGSGGGDFRYLYTDELHAKSFIADLEQALAGGQIISKSVAVLSSDFVVPYAGGQQTLFVEDLPSAPNMAVFQANDIVLLRSFSRAAGALTIGNCWGAVAGYTDGSGTQSWTFTRSGTTTYNTIAIRGTAQSSASAAATSRSVTKPTGVVSGDVLIAVVTYDGSADVVTASGWTELGNATGTDITAHVLYKVAGGSEPTSYTFSVANSHAIGAAITAYSNVASSAIDGFAIQANAAGANMTAPTTWATSAAGMLVFAGGVSNNTSSTPPSGMTELVDAGATGIRVYLADQLLSASGSTGAKTATIASSSFASVGALVLLRPTYSAMSSDAGAITPGTTVAAKSLVLDYGVSGNGFHEVNAIDGTYGANSPYSQVVTWATHPATGQTVRTRSGNLYGLFGQSNEYGFYAGDGTATSNSYVRLSSYTSAFNNVPISIYSSGTKIIGLDTTRGLDMEIDSADGDSNRAISFRSSGTTYDWIKTYSTGGWHYLKMASEPIAGLNNSVVLRTSAASTKESSIFISTTNAAGSDVSNYVYLHHKTDGTGELELSSDATTIFGPVTLSSDDLNMNGNDISSVRSIAISPPANTTPLSIVTPSSQGAAAISVGSGDCGSSYGPHISVGRNSNASTPAAGFLYMAARPGTMCAIWVDNTGVVRVNTAAVPTNANDTSGTVIGAQTSYVALKEDITPWDGDGALDAVLSLPLHSYRFNADEGKRQYHGIVINDSDRGAWFSENDRDNQTPVLNERNLFGYLVAAIKAQQKRIEYLEAQLC